MTRNYDPIFRISTVFAFVFLCCFNFSNAQIRIIINRVPVNTPVGDTLFLAGNFNNWNSSDPTCQFERQRDGTYVLNLTTTQNPLTCKITRGSWEKAEGNSIGKKLADRSFAISGRRELVLSVMSWEDRTPQEEWSIVLSEIPATTPPDEAIYIAGNFNDWQTGDENFRLHRDPATGMRMIRIPRSVDSLWYQFNRGTLFSVESDNFGSPAQHRAAWRGSSVTRVNARVSAWTDTASSGNRIHVKVIMFTAVLVVSVLIAFYVFRYNPERFKKKTRVEKEKPKHLPVEDENALKARLNDAMQVRKLFLNPKLTLQELSETISTNVHTLSWLLNEGYGKNFFDFVNEHRIEEFKRVTNENQFPGYSFAEVAMECGFSSKTTFNRAFKKHTGKTPREYFNETHESDVNNSESQITLLKKRGQMF